MLWRADAGTGWFHILKVSCMNGIQRSFVYWLAYALSAGLYRHYASLLSLQDPEKVSLVIKKSIEEHSKKSSEPSA